MEKSHQPTGRPVEIDSRSTEEDKSDLSSNNVKERPLNTLEALDTTLGSEIQATKKRKFSQNIIIHSHSASTFEKFL